jgi:hypothetical protein
MTIRVIHGYLPWTIPMDSFTRIASSSFKFIELNNEAGNLRWGMGTLSSNCVS